MEKMKEKLNAMEQVSLFEKIEIMKDTIQSLKQEINASGENKARVGLTDKEEEKTKPKRRPGLSSSRGDVDED